MGDQLGTLQPRLVGCGNLSRPRDDNVSFNDFDVLFENE